MIRKATRRRYVYSFNPWPDETLEFAPAMYQLFRTLDARIEMKFTKPEFEGFRSGLLHHGITLREIQRVPYVKPETVR